MALFRCGGVGSGIKVTKITLTSITRKANNTLEIDLSQYYADYANLTVDNIAFEITSEMLATRTTGVTAAINKSYTPTTGVLTISCNYGIFGSNADNNKANIYIFK